MSNYFIYRIINKLSLTEIKFSSIIVQTPSMPKNGKLVLPQTQTRKLLHKQTQKQILI